MTASDKIKEELSKVGSAEFRRTANSLIQMEHRTQLMCYEMGFESAMLKAALFVAQDNQSPAQTDNREDA